MENKRKLCSTALASAVLVFVFLILISAVASAAQITKIGSGSDPAVYGNKVVWTNEGVIHLYDLTARTDTTISSSAAFYPAIYGNKLVWHDESSGTPRLTVYDIPTAKSSYITQNVDGGSIPAIYGSRIVWSANSNVYMRDISTSTQTWIVGGESPDIYETRIAYSYDDGDMPRIFVYDIITKKTITASPYSGHLSQPHIYGNNVIWSDFYTRLGHISMYNIATDKTIDVTSAHTDNGDPDNPDAGEDTGIHSNINGDKIVYSKSSDDKFGNAGVYIYNIPTGQSTPLYNYPMEVYTTPDVYGNIVVWGIKGDYSGSTASNAIYVCDLAAESEKPTATFTANVTSGTAPLKVQFTSTTTGNPTNYYWVFEPSTSSDWNSHNAVTAVHTFTNPGVYTITLIVTNTAGSNTTVKPNYIVVTDPTVIDPVITYLKAPVANFSSNITSGNPPLSVQFYDFSQNAVSRVWDFNNDGQTDSNDINPIHVYTAPGTYIVNLTVTNENGISSRLISISVGEEQNKNQWLPVADFSTNTSSGYAPLLVKFTDLSQNAISRIWDFNNDGQPESTDATAVYAYTTPGIYTVKLTAINENGTTSKTATITVLKRSSSSSGSRSGSSKSSSGGGVGGSPEPAKNIEVKELSQAFITSGKEVKFDFTKNATCVVYISFDSKKTLGKTTTIAEMLKGKSALVSELPPGEVYKSFNVWVGNGGVATAKNIDNAVVCFKVEKTWIEDKKINPDSITLNRYSNKKWDHLPVSLSGEDDRFLYFTAETPEFSSFAVTGTPKNLSDENTTETQPESEPGIIDADAVNKEPKEPEAELATKQEESPSMPGFELICGVVGLLAVFLYKRK